MVFVKPTDTTIISMDENYVPYASYTYYDYNGGTTGPESLSITIHMKEPFTYLITGSEAKGLWLWLDTMIRTQTLEVEPLKLKDDSEMQERLKLARENSTLKMRFDNMMLKEQIQSVLREQAGAASRKSFIQ